MKMLTLNAHSLREENYEEKLGLFMDFILRERADVIALQEVNQAANARPARDLCGMVRLGGSRIPLREDNHGLRIARALEHAGIPVSWAYLPIKLGYGRYDEGVALMRLNGRITAADICTISSGDDYRNWRTRRVLGVQADGRPEWFYSVHMGWWQDAQEPFEGQWARLNDHLRQKCSCSRVWLMGDFNAPAELRGQGYDLIAASGWRDARMLAEERRGNHTVPGAIDGWREGAAAADAAQGVRIDHVWCSEDADVKKWRVVLDGRDGCVVSDHFGVVVETQD